MQLPRNHPVRWSFGQSPRTGFALLEEFADQSLLDQEIIPEQIKQGYETPTIPTEIVNKDVKDQTVEELGPSTSAKCAYHQCFPGDNADHKEGDVTPHQKNHKIATENYLKAANMQQVNYDAKRSKKEYGEGIQLVSAFMK